MNNFNIIYFEQELSKFDQTNLCNLCSQKYIDPVRIKICGHYFCEKCLIKNNKTNEQCPKCKEYYETNDIDYKNTARKVEKYLNKMRILLNSNVKEINHTKSEITRTNSFIYENKVYHVHFSEELLKKVNMKGESPLHLACKKKRLEEVKNLLKEDIDINLQDFAGWAPIHEAVEIGSVEIIQILLEHGALINIMGEEYTTPLHKAAMLKSEEIIKILLKYGADKSICDYFGKKPTDYLDDERLIKIFETNVEPIDRIQKLFCCKKLVAFCYYVENEYLLKLKNSKNVKIENEFNPRKVTHFFIRKTHKCSVKILSAMVNGCFIISQEWIDNYLEGNHFIDIPNFTFILNNKLNIGIRKAMLNSLLKLPQLFDGIRFYIQNHKKKVCVNELKITKDELVSLITEGGGKILPRAPTPRTCETFKNFPFHSNKNNRSSRCCHYIIFEEKDPPALLYQMPDLKHRSSKWLIDCITCFCIID